MTQQLQNLSICPDSADLNGLRIVGSRLLMVVCVTSVLLAQCSFAKTVFADEREMFFESKVRPLLLNKCIECHGPTKQEQGVRFDQRAAVLEGKVESGRIVNPESPSESRLLQVIAWHDDDTQMPPAAKLPEADRAILEQWVRDGAIWPANSDLEGEARRRAERWREHWAFQKPKMPDMSQLPGAVHPVDYFIHAKLTEKGLTPSPEASTRTIIRRLSYAITGLPPQSQDFADGAAADQAGRHNEWLNEYTDRLLSSPHFGERWGRYWLDVSRFADTKGYVFTEDREYPEAWKYREWVIRSLNSDMPYDEFLKRQLAADQMPGAEDGTQLAAMGYLTLGRRFLNNRHDIIDDRLDVTIRGMMGLTIGCARCHDHKFDPIPAADYYSLYGVFDSSDEPRNEPSTLRLVDRAEPVQPVIFLRGNPANRGPEVPRRFLTSVAGTEAPAFSKGSGRLELANSIASADNPFTTRVAVNRIWMHLIGRGLVDSPSDFGVRTDPPTHPELMDYLATTFVQNNWSQKNLIRLIVTSATFRQSSDRRPDCELTDPENRLLARMNRHRLDFEALRDSILAVSGTLDRSIGGASVDITSVDAAPRRTIYARIDRQNLPGLFRTFDFANPDVHAPQRFQTTVPQQALFQLNSPFVMDQATTLADSVADTKSTPADRARILFERIMMRSPTDSELAQLETYITELTTLTSSGASRTGWSYGYGPVAGGDSADGAGVSRFTMLPRFQRGSWQGGRQLPDETLGWVMLNRNGGHPGNDLLHAAIRRWTTDTACRVRISGEVGHSKPEGDGVRARIFHRQRNTLVDVVAQNANQQTAVNEQTLAPGDTIDFVVDCRGDANHDSFQWKIEIVALLSDGTERTWNSEQDFGRVQTQPLLDPWAQLAQTLILTNEFVFVD
ncbi:MAG: PSD1 domain-containing protein [Planctomyces sp.]|nr:PSD1 domain-containing protein [Planctomyces sp.]